MCDQRAGEGADRKRGVRSAKRAQRDEKRAWRRWTRRCFWTWPFGHAWEATGMRMGSNIQVKCAGCNREEWR